MFAKGFNKKQNTGQLDATSEYGDNVYAIHSGGNANHFSASFDHSIKAQNSIDNPTLNDNRLNKGMIAAIFVLALSINVVVVFLVAPNRFAEELSSVIPSVILNIWIDKSSDADANPDAQPLEFQLKNMALNIMQFDNWNAPQLEKVNLYWQSLNVDQRANIKQEVWYQLFENALIHELNLLRNNTKIAKKKPAEALALVSLANSLDVRDTSSENNRNTNQTSLSKAQENPRIKPKKENRKNTTAQNVQSSNAQKSKKTTRTLAVNTNSHNTPSKNQKQALQQQSQKKQKETNTKRTTLAGGPTPSELNDITVKYIESYEEGNLKKLMSLFSSKAISNRFDNLEEIEGEYANLFQSTSERQMFIHDLKWSYNKGRAIGKGRMETLLMSDTDSNVLATNSRVQLVVEKLGNSTRIIRFYALEN